MFTLLSLLFLLPSCGNDTENSGQEESQEGTASANVNRNNTVGNAVYGRLEFPRLKGGSNNIVIIHRASFGVNYCVEWDTDLKPAGWKPDGGETLRAQRWSCYQMHPSNSSSNTSRKPRETGDFTEYPNDPNLPSQYHFTVDPYWNSGYDHGHIIASADRGYGYNPEANRQTFYLTNMQPQVNSFNTGVWEAMERQVRTWNSNKFRDTLYIVKGGTIDDNNNIITRLGSGVNRIPVPKYFFMAVLCKNKDAANGGYKALGFWVRHQRDNNTDLSQYVVPIRELEQLTGIDFFCNLPDDIENAVETLSRENIVRAWNL